MNVRMKVARNISLLLTGAALILSACEGNRMTADDIVNKAIERHGGGLYDQADISFDFRKMKFNASITDGLFEYSRSFKDNAENDVEDVLSNDSFFRKINNKQIDLSEKWEKAYANSTNSVIYFALLPYKLNDVAVNKQLMCTSKIKGESYYKVEITFDKNGGGEDFEDVYVYWIHKKHFTIDYFAYSFHINGGGVRFREAYNQREVNGIRFQDYINYTIDEDFPAQELDYAFESGKLRELSRIDLENIQVKLK